MARRIAAGFLLCTAAVVLALGAGLDGVADAELEKAQDTEDRVTTYLALQFSSRRCDGESAYKINTVSRRWQRSTLRRSVRAQYETRGKGKECDGDPVDLSNASQPFRPCFGCDGNSRRWTPDYISVLNWPYLRLCHCKDESAGAIVQTQVRNSRGRTLGYSCLKIPLIGSLDSPIC